MSSALLHNAWCRQLNLKWPLIQAPLGGLTTPELVAAVSNTGALGSLGGAYLTSELLEQSIKSIQLRTKNAFGINLFVPTPTPKLSPSQITAALKVTQGYRNELALAPPLVQAPFAEHFDEQFALVLKYKPAVFSFTFGLLSKELIKECRQQQIITLGTATTLEEGLVLQEYGVDAVIAQGAEAGGHRASFSAEQQDSLIGTLVLTQMLVHALHIPIIASGGIMDGAGIAAVLMLGAQAAQLGTAFLLCPETASSAAYRAALSKAQGQDTQLTRAFSGRWARGLQNRFMSEMAQHDSSILPFPAQNAFTRDIRKKAAELGRAEFLSLWAGQGVGLIRQMPAQELVHTLYEETVLALEARS